MGHHLPKNPELREAFDVRNLVAMATGERPFPTLKDAMVGARETFSRQPNGMVKRIYSIVMEADDRVSLISIGPRGGWKREHTFGWGMQGNGRL